MVAKKEPMLTEDNNIMSIDPESYAKIINGLDLIELSLVSCQSKQDSKLFNAIPNTNLPLDLKEKIHYEISNDIITIYHEYSVVSKYKNKRILMFDAEYQMLFKSSEEFTSEFFDVFKVLALPMYTWPYLREYIDSMTCKMGLPRLVLPLRKA